MSERRLRISSGINLAGTPATDLREYMLRGIDFNAAAGFEALDFNTALWRYAPDNYREIMAEAKEYAASKGLRFELCHLPFGNKPWTKGADEEAFNNHMKHSIDAASILGVDYAVVHPVDTTKRRIDMDYNKSLELEMRVLSPFVNEGAKKGVNVVVENMRIAAEQEKLMATPFVLGRENAEPEHLSRVADKLGIGICWDFGHAHCSHIDSYEALKIVGSRLKMTHVCDNHKYLDEHLAPFFGSIDWAGAAKGMSEIGYRGLFNFEVSANKLPLETREIYAKYLISAAEKIIGMMD